MSMAVFGLLQVVYIWDFAGAIGMNDEGTNNFEADPKRSALSWFYLLIGFASVVIPVFV